MRNPNARVSDPHEFITCSGDQFHITYSAKIMEDGTIFLKESGKDDIQAMINSYRDQTDMAYILRQLQLGDTSVLRDGAMYGDFTVMPNNMLEAMQLMIDGEKAFYELDLETRQKFDNNYRQWMMSAGSEDWLKKMNISVEKQEPVVDQKGSEVVE